MSEHQFRAPPMSRDDIEDFTDRIRRVMGLAGAKLPVAELLEIVLPRLLPDFVLDIRERAEMGSKHGAVDPAGKLIILRDDVYDGMINEQGRDRFTVVHEIGHALLHGRVTLARARTKPKPYECPEWQANTFASALLMPRQHVRVMSSVQELTTEFGVSKDAATVRLRTLKMVLPQM